jgi:hypothetical protein
VIDVHSFLSSHLAKLTYNKFNQTYTACCPICREGNSWLKRKRFYFYVKTNSCYCFNCGYSGKLYKLYYDITGKLIGKQEFNNIILEPEEAKEIPEILPKDSINLFETAQIYKNIKNIYFKETIHYITHRRLHSAINKPKSLWFSSVDYVHKNRLIIPFYDLDNKIVYYQSRKLPSDKSNLPNYLSKIGGERSLFNINKVSEYPYIFIFEGPIDSCFIKNGVAVSGINKSRNSLTEKQNDQLKNFPLHSKIWVLDNQYKDETAHKKTKQLIESKQKVFIWPKNLNYKDFNEMCIEQKTNEIETNFIIKNTFEGPKARLKLL